MKPREVQGWDTQSFTQQIQNAKNLGTQKIEFEKTCLQHEKLLAEKQKSVQDQKRIQFYIFLQWQINLVLILMLSVLLMIFITLETLKFINGI